MKKIIFLIPNLKHGGAEKVLVNLVNNLDKSKYEITVQTLFDVGVNKKYLSPYVNYQYFLKKEFRGNSFLFKMFSAKFWWKRIIKDDYDIAVSYLEGPTARILSGCKNPNTKKITWLHIELNNPKLASLGFKNVKEAKSAYESFDKIIAVSENVKSCFLENLDVKKEIQVLYNTNETEQILEQSLEKVENDKFIIDDIPAVCSVAKLMKTKGYDRLIEAHKKLIEEGIMHRVYVLGIGEEQSYLEKKIKEYNIENSFVLLGFDENPYKYVSKCDLYVCSSRREGFSTAVTESLIVGTPVVSTNCSGANELLGYNDDYGIVVENSTEGIYEGIKKMLTNKELLLHYKEKAKVRGGFFSRENTVKAVEEMLDTL